MNIKIIGAVGFVVLSLIAFFISLEDVLDHYFNIDTVFKPYRVLMIAFLLMTFYQRALKGFVISKINAWLAALFIASIVIAIIRYTYAPVSLENVVSSGSLILVNFLFYLALCNSGIDFKRLVILMIFFLLGLFSNFLIFDSSYVGGRFSGFFSNPNSLGFTSLLGVVVILFLFSKTKSSILKSGLLMLTVACLFMINESGSRTAFYLAILVLGIICGGMILSKNSRSVVYLISMGIMISFLIIIDVVPISDMLSDVKINALEREKYKTKIKDENERIILAKASYDAFVESNFMGLGLGQFQYIENFYPLVAPHNSVIALDRLRKNKGLSAHGTVWSIMAEIGVMGLVFFFGFLITLVNKLARNALHRQSFSLLNLELIIVLFFYSLTHVIFLSQIFWFFLGLLMMYKVDKIVRVEKTRITDHVRNLRNNYV